jgi:hypothetical protein
MEPVAFVRGGRRDAEADGLEPEWALALMAEYW